MKVGDKVKVVSKELGRLCDRNGIIVDDCPTFLDHIGVEIDGQTHWICQSCLEVIEEHYPIHLDLSLEDMNALAELGKMKDNLELLERLLKRAKGETND